MRFHRWEGLSKAPDPSGWRRESDMCAHIGRRLPPNLCVRSKWQRTPDVSAHIGSALPTLRVRLLTSRENAWHGSVCDRRLTTKALTSVLPCHSSTLDVITRAEISLGQGWASPSGSSPPEACPLPFFDTRIPQPKPTLQRQAPRRWTAEERIIEGRAGRGTVGREERSSLTAAPRACKSAPERQSRGVRSSPSTSRPRPTPQGLPVRIDAFRMRVTASILTEPPTQ